MRGVHAYRQGAINDAGIIGENKGLEGGGTLGMMPLLSQREKGKVDAFIRKRPRRWTKGSLLVLGERLHIRDKHGNKKANERCMTSERHLRYAAIQMI